VSDYTYDALVTNVIDGDTIDADVDLGFDVHTRMRFRLAGIDTPEIRSSNADEKAAGLKAKEYLTKLIGGKRVVIESIKDKAEKFGRYLCRIMVAVSSIPPPSGAAGTMLDVNEHLIQAGYAKPYDGGKR